MACVMLLLLQQPEQTRVVLPSRDAVRERVLHVPLCLTNIHLLYLTVAACSLCVLLPCVPRPWQQWRESWLDHHHAHLAHIETPSERGPPGVRRQQRWLF